MQKRNLFPTVRAGPRTAVFLCQNCSGVHCGIMCSLDPNVNFIAVFVCVCVCVCGGVCIFAGFPPGNVWQAGEFSIMIFFSES